MTTEPEDRHEEYAERPNTASEPQRGKEESEIVGCSFSIYPMDSNYIDIINGALSKVDMSKVWRKTDDVSTMIRGRIAHVFDVSRAVFAEAAEIGEHVTLRASYSIGCFGDEAVDIPPANNNNRLNGGTSAGLTRPVSVKFALYPLGNENYAEVINSQIEAIEEQGIQTSVKHYETRLEGDCEKVFNGLENVFRNTKKQIDHTVMTVAMVAHNIEDQ